MSVLDAPAVGVREPSRRRRVTLWIVLGVAILVVGTLGGVLSTIGQWNERDSLDPRSAGALGTRALAQILEQQGVEVIVSHDRTEASRLLGEQDATLVLPDAPALSDDAVRALTGAAVDVVLIEPRARDLRLLIPGSTPAGFGSGVLTDPGCDVADAVRAGAIRPGALLDAPGGGVQACYPEEQGAGLLVREDGERRIAAVDGRSLFTNESLAADGNAALALNLMGRHAVVVWYMPSLGDSDLADTTPLLGDLTPDWVSPVIVLLLCAGGAAALWRGRRFGPLVVERLPVTVRASETTEGRGRLYARTRDAGHAADQLRIGALGRLARALSLGPAASATEIADAAAVRTGFDRAAVRGILFDDIPADDGALLTLRTRLHDLESAVQTAVRPERNTR